MNHFASRGFWRCYKALPSSIQELADKNFALLQADLSHPSLYFTKVGRFRSARVGLQHRALAVEVDDGLLWFWIGIILTTSGLLPHSLINCCVVDS